MAKTTEWLSDAEYARVAAAAGRWEGQRLLPGIVPVDILRLFEWCGIHPSPLSDPVGHRVRFEDRDGVHYLEWDRPKKRGVRAATAFPILDADLPAIRRVVGLIQERPYGVRQLLRFFSELGRRAGVRGVSPRSVRHTAIFHRAREGWSMHDICTRFNVTTRTAMIYLGAAGSDRDKELLAMSAVKRLGKPTPLVSEVRV